MVVQCIRSVQRRPDLLLFVWSHHDHGCTAVQRQRRYRISPFYGTDVWDGHLDWETACGVGGTGLSMANPDLPIIPAPNTTTFQDLHTLH